MQRLLGLAMVVMLVVLVSCGGGGGGNGGGSIPPGIIVKAGDRLSTTVGDAVVTSGVFPTTGNVTITERPAPKVAQPNFGASQPMLTVSSTVQPDGGFTVSYPDTSNGAPAMAGIFDGNTPVSAFPVTKENGRLVVAMDPAYLPANRSRGISLISILIGIIRNYLPPDPTVTLKQVGTASAGQSLVYIPGLLQKAEDAEPTVSAVKENRGYGSAYIVDYDWRAPVAVVSLGLRDVISELPAKSTDMVAYSKGGLIGRYAMEQHRTTKATRRAMFLGVPNAGCSLTLAAIYGLLAATFLKSGVPLPFVDGPNSECLTELLPHSQLLEELSAEWYKQNGLVDYYFVAGQFGGFQTDLVVGTDSALLTGSSVIGNRTIGTIRRFTMDGQTHFTLDEAPVINVALQKMTTASTGVEISFSSNPVEASLAATSWASRVTFTNQTGQRVTNESLMLEGYIQHGGWSHNSWYDPSIPAGVAFPHQRTYWNYALDPGESVTLDLEHWLDVDRNPIGTLPPYLWSGSVRFILMANGDDGQSYETENILKLTTVNSTPKDPKTRATHLLTTMSTGGAGRRVGK